MEYPIKKLYFTKIFRIGVAYLLWATFYALIDQYHAHHAIQLRGLIYGIIYGHYHLWFLFMISGLYAATPIYRWIAQNEKVCIYFMVLSFVAVFCCNVFEKIPKGGSILAYTFRCLDLNLVGGYSIYFLLGHYLAKHKISHRSTRIGIYVIGGLAVCGTVIFNGAYSVYRGIAKEWVFSNLWPNTFMVAVSLFVFCQSHFSEMKLSQRQYSLISLFAKLSFGIYLVHAFFLEHLRLIGLPHFFIHPLLSIPITSCLTFMLSLFTIYIINKIPLLRKYAI